MNSYSLVNISTYLHLFISGAIILLPPKQLQNKDLFFTEILQIRKEKIYGNI